MGVLMSKAAARLLLPVALLLVVTACSGDRQAQTDPGPTVAIDGAAPPTERTAAVEQPLPRQDGEPGIKVASLPIGGAEGGGPCVQVSWSGNQIPEGFGVKVNKVRFEPGTYTLADNACTGSQPSCAGFVFRASETGCLLAIRPADPLKTERIQSERVSLRMTGRALCPDYGDAACGTFVTDVVKAPSSMTVARPSRPTAPTSDARPGDGNGKPAGTSSGPDPGTPSQDTGTGPGG
jgi:hypothetical protein